MLDEYSLVRASLIIFLSAVYLIDLYLVGGLHSDSGWGKVFGRASSSSMMQVVHYPTRVHIQIHARAHDSSFSSYHVLV